MTARAQGSTDDPVDVATWGLHCYCPTARRTPHAVVAEGSNGRLLYAARTGISMPALRAAGLSVTEEQVARLMEFGLLERDGDVLRTAFPLVGRAEVTALRRRSRSLGEALAGRLRPSVGRLRRGLEDMDLGGSAYAVVFGYALDGLVWDRLARRGAVPDTALGAARPWWNGAFWAVHPARDGAAGTNFVDGAGATLVQVWTDATVARLNALAAAPGLPDAVRGLLAGDRSRHSGEVVDGAGVTWRLRRPDGRPAIPVLGDGGPVDRLAEPLADAVAQALVDDGATAMRAIVPCDDARVATVVVAHELIWDVIEALIAAGTVDLATSVAADPSAPIDLLYVQKSAVGRDPGASPAPPA